MVTEEGLDVQKEGAVLTAEQRKKYLQVEEQMKAIMVQALAEEYALPLLGLDRFQDMKTRLSQVVLGEVNTRLMVVSQKIRRLKFKGSIKQFIKFTKSLLRVRIVSACFNVPSKKGQHSVNAKVCSQQNVVLKMLSSHTAPIVACHCLQQFRCK